MATSNFWYEHRCVVTTDEDYESGNYPTLGKDLSNPYYHHRTATYEVETDEDFYFHKIVLTAGYYEHACIDYDSVERITGYRTDLEEDIDNFNYDSRKLGKKGLYNDLMKYYGNICKKYGLTSYRFNKLTKGLDLDKAEEVIVDYLKKQEEVLVNKVIDKIKEDYGYEELTRFATFSNGETLYKRIA